MGAASPRTCRRVGDDGRYVVRARRPLDGASTATGGPGPAPDGGGEGLLHAVCLAPPRLSVWELETVRRTRGLLSRATSCRPGRLSTPGRNARSDRAAGVRAVRRRPHVQPGTGRTTPPVLQVRSGRRCGIRSLRLEGTHGTRGGGPSEATGTINPAQRGDSGTERPQSLNRAAAEGKERRSVPRPHVRLQQRYVPRWRATRFCRRERRQFPAHRTLGSDRRRNAPASRTLSGPRI